MKVMGMFLILSFSYSLIFLTSCSKETTEEEEYANWQEKNEAMIEQWASNSAFATYKTYTKDQATAGKHSDYIYVQVLEEGSSDISPMYTDTVRVMYRGRLIPSKSYPEGYVFDQTYSKDFSWKTANATDFVSSALVDGFATAIMKMHKGDLWRVHIPYTLGYGTSSSSSGLPAYSDLIFEIALVDFWSPGEVHPSFKTR
jgi:FKBP-type peptidyl-prolyl cis-trans isomerase FklB